MWFTSKIDGVRWGGKSCVFTQTFQNKTFESSNQQNTVKPRYFSLIVPSKSHTNTYVMNFSPLLLLLLLLMNPKHRRLFLFSFFFNQSASYMVRTLPAGDGNFYFSCRDSGVERIELSYRCHHLASRSIRKEARHQAGKGDGAGSPAARP